MLVRWARRHLAKRNTMYRSALEAVFLDPVIARINLKKVMEKILHHKSSVFDKSPAP